MAVYSQIVAIWIDLKGINPSSYKGINLSILQASRGIQIFVKKQWKYLDSYEIMGKRDKYIESDGRRKKGAIDAIEITWHKWLERENERSIAWQ